MTPAFSSLHDFWLMGGYARYVWLAVAVTLLSLAALLGHGIWQRRRILRDVRQQQRRAQYRQRRADAVGPR
ncbi:heme exporter protein CcmD [Pantoea sp. 1.19]|uniref:heme exporter protein CcmD n=1 Tax=Pantoea sp. 1.19 TaxID=1925589 RepID=UPI000948FCE4|nr:heme exporter protein CcmD [Pantoea sp. 1.19]